MPAKESQKWTEKQLEKIKQWVDEKWGAGKPCPQCDVNDWQITAAPAAISVGGPGGRVFLEDHYPCFVVLCRNCGYMIFVSAIAADIGFPEKGEADNA